MKTFLSRSDNILDRKRLGGKQLIDIEIALATITLALLILLAALAAFSARIARERNEIRSIRKKIDNAEASIKEISCCLSTIEKHVESA
jgi:hypothetical protein